MKIESMQCRCFPHTTPVELPGDASSSSSFWACCTSCDGRGGFSPSAQAADVQPLFEAGNPRECIKLRKNMSFGRGKINHCKWCCQFGMICWKHGAHDCWYYSDACIGTRMIYMIIKDCQGVSPLVLSLGCGEKLNWNSSQERGGTRESAQGG